ncbi:hypothetical protein E8E11_003535 [Didymella keratinophila]|nr:hypothetical protein E8E11_003535 [Didymella keratinophila]
MNSTDPAQIAADASIKVIHENDPLVNRGCAGDEMPEIALRAMAQSHKINAARADKAVKLVRDLKNKVERLKTENARLCKENEALKKKVKELGKVEDSEEWVKLSDEDME